MTWESDNKWEAAWWGDCVNTHGEEVKQVHVYAPRLGLQRHPKPGNPYNFHTGASSIMDVGGGPVSLLLKTEGFNYGAIIDPLPVPKWVEARYNSHGIAYTWQKAEDIVTGRSFDEAWMYNCLQHTEDPVKIAQNIRKTAKVIRVFEWINTEITKGHPHSFTAEQLDKMFGGEGKVEMLNGEHGCYGRCWYGIFEA